MKRIKELLGTAKKWIVSHRKTILAIALILIGIIVTRSVYLLVKQGETQQQIEEKVEYWEKYFERTDQEVIKKIQSPNGATLMLVIGNADTVQSHCVMAVYESGDGTIQENSIGYAVEQYDSKIFFKEENKAICTSTMTKIETCQGTDVVVLIQPKISRRIPVEHSQVPYDTLNSDFTPVYATPENKEDDLEDGPMWMLALSCDDLPDDYELHYGEFVLTAEDIRNGTWSSD